MKKNIQAYKKNQESGMSYTDALGKVFRRAEDYAVEMIEAIDNKMIEKRYCASEEILRLMTGLHGEFESENAQGIDLAMQKYCLNNMSVLTKINLKNDKALAITLRESFSEVAEMWENYQVSR